VHDHFLTPIIASLDSSRLLLTRTELTTIFLNFIDIWNFHHAFSSALTALLHPSLSHLDVPNPNPPPLSALLLSHFPYLSLYTPFITAFPSSISFLSRPSAPFALYLRTQERDPRCGQLGLTDWLLSASTARLPAQDSLHARPGEDMDIGCIFSVPTRMLGHLHLISTRKMRLEQHTTLPRTGSSHSDHRLQ
jgi:hypothetical protein